jgi:hypothetical protein
MASKRVRVGAVNTAILSGKLDLSVWGEDELIRGQRRAKNGKFQGRPPKIVPKAIHDELVRRRLSKAGDLLDESIVDAVLLLRQVVTDDEAQYADRIKAAQLIMDRVMGRAPQTVRLEVEPPWVAALAGAIAEAGPISPPTPLELDEYDEAEEVEEA